MSKKQLNSRLENLFSEFGETENLLPLTQADQLPAWTWEADSSGVYLVCSQEVSECLGIQPARFVGKQLTEFALAEQSQSVVKAALQEGLFPCELDIYFQSAEGGFVPVHFTIQSMPGMNSHDGRLYGSAQIIPLTAQTNLPAVDEHAKPVARTEEVVSVSDTSAVAPLLPTMPVLGEPQKPLPHKPAKKHHVETTTISASEFLPSGQLWSEAASKSLANNQLVALPGSEPGATAAIAAPIQMRDRRTGVIEIVDDSNQRTWTEDEKLLVQEIARQLSLALENAELYAAVQQELTERIRAEQETINRNRDLATLNQIGQSLSKLVSPAEIYDLVVTAVGNVLDNRNLQIARYDSTAKQVSFPINRIDGQDIPLEARKLSDGPTDYVLQSGFAFVALHPDQSLYSEKAITAPDPMPKSCISIPMVAGSRVVGALTLMDFDKEDAYTHTQIELLSTIASQATTALENANLFEEIKTALSAIETRERYQANVAKGVAILTESGTRAMADFLSSLADAAKCSRIYYAQILEDERGQYWRVSGEWNDPELLGRMAAAKTPHMPIALFPNFASSLREIGLYSATSSQMSAPEQNFLVSRDIQSVLLLAVPGKTSTPSFLAFEQYGEERHWQDEEINVLRVAADALSSTISREELLVQVQASLDETENLYNASHKLALANDLQEMVEAIMSGLRVTAINRSVLLIFQNDTTGKKETARVEANWHSGEGLRPPAVGSSFLSEVSDQLLKLASPVFYDDVKETTFDQKLLDLLQDQKIRSLAVLPLWAGKQQIGAFLLMAEEKHFFSGREIRFYPPLVDQMATAVENVKLFAQTQQSLAETELLYEVGQGIAQSSTVEDLVKLVGARVMPHNADLITLVTVSQTEEGKVTELEVNSVYDRATGYRRSGIRLPAAAFNILEMMNQEMLVISNIDKAHINQEVRALFESFGSKAVCLIPLFAANHTAGVLIASAKTPTEFSPEDVHLLQVVGSNVAVAIERQRLLQEATRRALELQTAAEIARDTSSTLSLDVVFNKIVTSLIERFNYYHASIFLLDESAKYAVIQESTGEAGKEMKARKHRLAVGSKSVIGSATSQGIPVVLNDVTDSPNYYANPLLPETRAEIGIPLKSGERVIGALDIQSKVANQFTPGEIAVLQILADQIAVAIENARAFEIAQKAFEEMREADRVKSQFLANMSHELRTPLNSIIGFSRVILKGIDGPINETQQQDLTAIYNSGQHLLELINNILDLSKIEAGKMELQIVELNVSDIINTAMSTAVGLVKDKPVRLNQVIQPNLPPILGDPTRVRQILLNFISNACKFTEEGEITVEASLVTSPKGKPEVMITVADSGPGIAEEDQVKLFQPFSQVDDSPTRKTGGTGLGLSISRSLVEIQGGRIGLLKSEVGRGTTFFFTLPIPTNEAVPDTQITDNLDAKPIVLAIDDDEQVISLYQRYLAPHGYQVVALSDPKLAVQRVKELMPFAVTLDVMMPEKDGWHVIHDLKSDPVTRNIPVIMCSILEEEEKGFSLGASDYLVKPFLQEELANAIIRLDHDGSFKDVLVIDDDDDDLRLVEKTLLETKRFKVRLAKGGEQGLGEIRKQQPDAIILDLFMPEMNGFAVLEELRTDAKFRSIPVLILTGADLTPEQLSQLSEFGSQMLLKSMLREKELLNTLEEILSRIKR